MPNATSVNMYWKTLQRYYNDPARSWAVTSSHFWNRLSLLTGKWEKDIKARYVKISHLLRWSMETKHMSTSSHYMVRHLWRFYLVPSPIFLLQWLKMWRFPYGFGNWYNSRHIVRLDLRWDVAVCRIISTTMKGRSTVIWRSLHQLWLKNTMHQTPFTTYCCRWSTCKINDRSQGFEFCLWACILVQ